MSPLPPGFRFVEELGPEFAKAVQDLTLQDLTAMGLRHPEKFANPDDFEMVQVQRRKLLAHPKRYCGIIYNGQLMGLLKVSPWGAADAGPFATGSDALQLVKLRARRQNTLPDHPLGIFALVVSNELDEEVAGKSVFVFLLEHALESAQGRTVNIIVPAAETSRPNWLIPTLEHYKFGRVGKRGKVAGLPRLKQMCYRRTATSS